MNLRATDHLIELWVSARARCPNGENEMLTRYLDRLEIHRNQILARQEAKAAS